MPDWEPKVKFLAPVRLPPEVIRHWDIVRKRERLPVGAFVAAAVMEKLGYSKEDVITAVEKCYPRGRRERSE